MRHIGKKCYITDEWSMYFGEWGIIQHIDEDGYYHVAIAGGTDSVPMFSRDQLMIPRKY